LAFGSGGLSKPDDLEWRIEMQAQLEVAKHTLFGEGSLQATNVKMFPGKQRDVTPAQMAEQVTKVISQLSAGDYDLLDMEEE
jgi:hypothetical protein